MWHNKFMKRVVAILMLCLASTAYALPNCPSDSSQKYDNCFGTYTWDTEEKYVGEWKDGKMHGQGTVTFGENSQWAGDKYVGEWKDGERTGQGTYTYANGDKYVGEFKDSARHGQGTYTYVGGRKIKGYYLNGDFVPDICEGMGLSKGTSGYEQCVLKLIDKL